MVGTGTASMFAGRAQPVEIHHRGIWYSGELVGWRHESSGRVSARVRCRVDGLLHSAWMDLADLRLPDPKRPPRKEPFPAVVHRSVPQDADEDEDDATRPHVLPVAQGTRPAKPAHAVQPPRQLLDVPAEQELPRDADEQPGTHLRRREAYAAVV